MYLPTEGMELAFTLTAMAFASKNLFPFNTAYPYGDTGDEDAKKPVSKSFISIFPMLRT